MTDVTSNAAPATSMLTDEQYVRAGGNICPHCHSCDIEGLAATLETDDHGAGQTVKCHDCGRQWIDQYQLIGWIPA